MPGWRAWVREKFLRRAGLDQTAAMQQHDLAAASR
jgi:hypothetical protein